MGPIEYIRKHILDLSQGAFAQVAGTSQATVSRWENGELEPDREQLDRIRNEVIGRGIAWDDRWFFEAPAPVPAVAAE